MARPRGHRPPPVVLLRREGVLAGNEGEEISGSLASTICFNNPAGQRTVAAPAPRSAAVVPADRWHLWVARPLRIRDPRLQVHRRIAADPDRSPTAGLTFWLTMDLPELGEPTFWTKPVPNLGEPPDDLHTTESGSVIGNASVAAAAGRMMDLAARIGGRISGNAPAIMSASAVAGAMQGPVCEKSGTSLAKPPDADRVRATRTVGGGIGTRDPTAA